MGDNSDQNRIGDTDLVRLSVHNISFSPEILIVKTGATPDNHNLDRALRHHQATDLFKFLHNLFVG